MANEKKINEEKYLGGWEGMSGEPVVKFNGKWIPESEFQKQIAEIMKKNKKESKKAK